jgi:hypothetical protein
LVGVEFDKLVEGAVEALVVDGLKLFFDAESTLIT